MTFPIQETIEKRRSVRTYVNKPLSPKDSRDLMAYAESLKNPFEIPVSFCLLESDNNEKGKKFGTYGVIKGTKTFVGAKAPNGEMALEAIGYNFEHLILYATHLGLGTCWLAATITRDKFAAALAVQEDELFPAVSSIGYPAEKISLTESLMRKGLNASDRKAWNALFYKDNFETPLTKEDAGKYAVSLEMLRLAPSASNKQPWRVVLSGDVYHFFESDHSESGPAVIQRVDLGIGICHFHLTALENGLTGEFNRTAPENISIPKDLQYICSWIPNNG